MLPTGLRGNVELSVLAKNKSDNRKITSTTAI